LPQPHDPVRWWNGVRQLLRDKDAVDGHGAPSRAISSSRALRSSLRTRL
jgi:hypothetical protein